MYVVCCAECKYLDLIEYPKDYACPRCAGKMLNMGITSNYWNNLSDEDKNSFVEAIIAKNKSQNDIAETETTDTSCITKNIDKTENTINPDGSISIQDKLLSDYEMNGWNNDDQIKEETSSDNKAQNLSTGKTIIKKILAIVLVIGLVAVFFYAVIIIDRAIDLRNKYSSAITMKNTGRTDEAYRVLNELGDYKDSIDICKQIDYEEALKYQKAGKYAKAYQLLTAIDAYEPADIVANDILSNRPYISVLNAEVGDEVDLGFYEQGSGSEPIVWHVLDKKKGNVLLVSKFILDAQQFNSQNTIDSTLINWLKTDFYNTAFSEYDEEIFDVTLLDRSDISKYESFLSNETDTTAYAKSKEGFNKGYTGNYYYWLGGEVTSDNGKAMARLVPDTGVKNNDVDVGEVTTINGVRPALWICPDGAMGFPGEYKYSGEAPSKNDSKSIEESNGGNSGSNKGGSISTEKKCPDCNGTGKQLVKWYSEGDWGEVTYTSYDCPKCKGTGKIK